VLFAANGSYLPNPQSAVHTFCHALPGAWHQMGVILSATDSLNWLSEITGRKAGALVDELGPELRAPGRVGFLPYLSGERTPHNDAAIRITVRANAGGMGVIGNDGRSERIRPRLCFGEIGGFGRTRQRQARRNSRHVRR